MYVQEQAPPSAAVAMVAYCAHQGERTWIRRHCVDLPFQRSARSCVKNVVGNGLRVETKGEQIEQGNKTIQNKNTLPSPPPLTLNPVGEEML